MPSAWSWPPAPSARPPDSPRARSSDPDVVRVLSRFISFASIASVAVGLLGLAGWMFRIPVLKSVIPGQVVIKPNAAVCLVLIGLSLWLMRQVDDRPVPAAASSAVSCWRPSPRWWVC